MSTTESVNALHGEPVGGQRRRRSDGERSREAILRAAANLATIEGIDGLSLGRLAREVGMSKSGLFAHFGSKEELQLATVDAAAEIFGQVVVGPALAAPDGLTRLRALCERFLAHVEESVFPGGCFFASVASELGSRPGPVMDRAMASLSAWRAMLEQSARDAQVEGDLSPDEDPVQLAFELNAFLLLANANYVITHERAALDRARVALDTRLAAASSD